MTLSTSDREQDVFLWRTFKRVTLWKYTGEFLLDKYKDAELIMSDVVSSFDADKLSLMWLLYPLRGLRSVLMNKAYYPIAAENYTWYIVYVLFSAVIYMIFVWPFLVVIYGIMFGPALAIVGPIQSVLVVNLWSMQWLRNSCLSSSRRLAAITSKVENFPPLLYPVSSNQFIDTTIHPRDLRHLSFWINDLPWMFAKTGASTIWGVLKIAISLVPIVGVIAVALIEAPTTGWLYSDSLRSGVGFYDDFAKHVAFGITSGLLDAVPLLSGLTYTTNTVGRAIMMKEEY